MTTDEAWYKISDKLNLLQEIKEKGFIEVSSQQIKEFKEPRLMAKFDTSYQRPKLFKDNGLSILPVSTRSYIIGTFDSYQKVLEPNNLAAATIRRIDNRLQTLRSSQITSESQAITNAMHYGMISEAVEDDIEFTVFGRMVAKTFEFAIKSSSSVNSTPHHISIKNSQIEIDAGFEGTRGFYFIEAKNFMVADFNIRQLYYPYRYFKSIVKGKPVVPIILSHSFGRFAFHIYRFNNESVYNSLELDRSVYFELTEGGLSHDKLLDIMANIEITQEPRIPFPQADSMNRILDILTIIYSKRTTFSEPLTWEEIKKRNGFTGRQADYYSNAARYLGLINNSNREYTLTPLGKRIIESDYLTKKILIVEAMLAHKVFKETMQIVYDNGGVVPEINQIVNIMKNSSLYNINEESTFERRAKTVSSWIKWLLDQVEE